MREKVKVVLCLSLLSSIMICSLPVETSSTNSNVPVGAYWYLWYGYNYTSYSWTGGLKTMHWNDSGSGIIVDKPLMGYYASLNNDTLKQQIDFMKKCSLSFAIISWWGWGIYNFANPKSKNQSCEAINNATINLFKYLKGSGETFKVAIMVEPFNIGDMNYTQVYNYVYNNFYQPYDQWIFKWQGKPLLCFFNPLVPSPNSYYTLRVEGSPPNNVDWVFWKGMTYLEESGGKAEPKNYNGNPVISEDGVASIASRYDDYHLYQAGERLGYMVYDRNCTNLYRESWSYLIEHKGDIKLILIYSWNEYHERSAIEPHIDLSGIGSYYLTNMTLYYINEFHAYTPTSTVTTTTSPMIITSTITATKTETYTETVTTLTTITEPKSDESDLIIYGLSLVIVILAIALIYSFFRRRK